VFYIVYGKDDGHADESLKLEWKGKWYVCYKTWRYCMSWTGEQEFLCTHSIMIWMNSLFVSWKKMKVRWGTIQASSALSVNISWVSYCDHFLKKMVRGSCVWLEEALAWSSWLLLGFSTQQDNIGNILLLACRIPEGSPVLEEADVQESLDSHAAELIEGTADRTQWIIRWWRFWSCCREASADYQCSEEVPVDGRWLIQSFLWGSSISWISASNLNMRWMHLWLSI
jgi:hypothetical protein